MPPTAELSGQNMQKTDDLRIQSITEVEPPAVLHERHPLTEAAVHHPTGPGTDVTANLDGYISVTPLRADLTAHETLEHLRERLDT